MNKKQIKDLKTILRSFELNGLVFSNIKQSLEKEQFVLEERQSDYGFNNSGYRNNTLPEIDERIIEVSEEVEVLQQIEADINNLVDLMRQTLSKIETDQFNAGIQPIIRETARVNEQIKNMRDPLFNDIARNVVMSGTTSASAIQRRYAIGYNRVGRIMDQLEAAGIVGPETGGKPRDVLVDPMTLEEMLGG